MLGTGYWVLGAKLSAFWTGSGLCSLRLRRREYKAVSIRAGVRFGVRFGVRLGVWVLLGGKYAFFVARRVAKIRLL